MEIIELERLHNDYQKRGGVAILDKCFDKGFCQAFGFNMHDRYLYSRIEHMLQSYLKMRDEERSRR